MKDNDSFKHFIRTFGRKSPRDRFRLLSKNAKIKRLKNAAIKLFFDAFKNREWGCLCYETKLTGESSGSPYNSLLVNFPLEFYWLQDGAV